jgi:hypothetical protein
MRNGHSVLNAADGSNRWRKRGNCIILRTQDVLDGIITRTTEILT